MTEKQPGLYRTQCNICRKWKVQPVPFRRLNARTWWKVFCDFMRAYYHDDEFVCEDCYFAAISKVPGGEA